MQDRGARNRRKKCESCAAFERLAVTTGASAVEEGGRQEAGRAKEEGGECFDAIQPHGTTWTEQAAGEVRCVRVEALLHGYLYMHRVPVLVVDKRATDRFRASQID